MTPTAMERLSLFVLLWTGMTSAGEAVRVGVPEGDAALLPCSLSTNEDLTGKFFDWKKDGQTKDDQKEVFLYEAGIHYNNGRHGQDEQFKGRVFHFEDKLKNGNASITIRKTKVDDSGNYTCVFPRHEPPQTFLIELVVGAAETSVTVLNETENWSLLQCKVLNAHPEPTVKWQDSTGDELPDKERNVTKTGDHFNVILLTNVTKTDDYRCEVTQEGISHQTASHIYVHLSGAAPDPGSSRGLIVAAVVLPWLMLLVVGLVLAVLYKKGYIKLKSKKGSRPPPGGEDVSLKP